MNATQALQLSKEFPKNRTVPRRIFDAMQKTRGEERYKFKWIVEGLYRDAKKIEYFNLLSKYFGD